LGKEATFSFTRQKTGLRSPTEAINTAQSTGRMMIEMAKLFAEFEREYRLMAGESSRLRQNPRRGVV
jgi:DNA invertase Pin-like site-specific DNA recombinase